MLSCEYCEIFKNTYFIEHLRTAASVLLIKKLLIKYLASADLCSIKIITWFLLRRFVYLLRIYFSLVISTNHSNRVKFYSKGYLFWYQDLDRFTQVVAHYLMSILMICKQTSGEVLQIKDTFFTLNQEC